MVQLRSNIAYSTVNVDSMDNSKSLASKHKPQETVLVASSQHSEKNCEEDITDKDSEHEDTLLSKEDTPTPALQS